VHSPILTWPSLRSPFLIKFSSAHRYWGPTEIRLWDFEASGDACAADSGRISGNPEVIRSPVGLVPINALVILDGQTPGQSVIRKLSQKRCHRARRSLRDTQALQRPSLGSLRLKKLFGSQPDSLLACSQVVSVHVPKPSLEKVA
jgi:hypothetical protein